METKTVDNDPDGDYFGPISGAKTVLLTTYRRDGTPVGTPVHVVAESNVAYIRTFDPSGKLKRMRRNPYVEVAPSTMRGRVTGPALAARARVLEGEESNAVARALARKYPLAHGKLIPWFHRRKGLTTVHIELTPASEGEPYGEPVARAARPAKPPMSGKHSPRAPQNAPDQCAV
ncbi:MAG: PPOX class F420-dependent oxidoreductase [Acidimicrobiales bacterium]